jgi:hypothetical protein
MWHRVGLTTAEQVVSPFAMQQWCLPYGEQSMINALYKYILLKYGLLMGSYFSQTPVYSRDIDLENIWT